MNSSDQVATQLVVVAGKKLIFDKKNFQTLKAGMTGNAPLAQKLAVQAAGVVKILQDKAQGSIPRQVLIPAASMLLLEIAKFAEDAKLANPTPQDIKQAGTILIQIMQRAFPVTQPRFPQAAPQQAAQPTPAAPAPPQRGLIGQTMGG